MSKIRRKLSQFLNLAILMINLIYRFKITLLRIDGRGKTSEHIVQKELLQTSLLALQILIDKLISMNYFS